MSFKMAMEDLTLRYFDAEMRYLREAGKEFALAHPDRAAMLDLDKAGMPDPFVERLFEGFAFSIGRLREKIDDDLPEFTEGLVSLLWPHYLRTIPSLSVVEITPNIQYMKMSEKVPKGFEVISQPVGPKKTVCRYRTTAALPLRPIQISQVSLRTEIDGRSLLCLRFNCSDQADWEQIDLSKLSIYLNGDGPTSSALHLALTKRIAQLYWRTSLDTERKSFDGYFAPKGFGEDDYLWPKSTSAFSGYQLLLEYFTFREKFMFVTLHGLEKIKLAERTQWFELELVLSEQWDVNLPLKAEHLRLHCTPVINLFDIDADPLVINGLESEYLLRPVRIQDGHTEIYSVDEVVGSVGNIETRYVPFTSFQHKGGMQRSSAPERYYHTRVKRGLSGLHDTWLILGGQDWQPEQSMLKETVSLQMTGTNGQLPRKALQSTLLNRCAQALQIPLQVRNLCKPSLPVYPPAEDRFHWRILSHLGSSFLNLMANAEVLRGTLALYNWTDDEMNKRKLDALLEVKHEQIQRFEQGYLVRGVDIQVTLDSNGFTGEGDIHLFGEMLNRFFALYADIHLFNQLTLIIQPAGKVIRWNENQNII